MSATAQMTQLDKPNVVFPLASSYNERGVDGFANTITNSLDQRKINSIYEVALNSATGKPTLTLCKRPGVAISANSYGTTGQVGYLISNRPSATGPSDIWVFSTSGNDTRVSNTSATTVIVTAAGYAPVYVDTTAISGTPTSIVQLRNATNAQRIFYASAIASWTEITDSDFTTTPIGKMEFFDGYAFILDSMARIYNSDLNSLASWTAGNYIAKQIKQDVPLGLARFGKQLLAFGHDTIEVFRNAGNAVGSPLVSVPELMQNVGGIIGMQLGIQAGHYYAFCGGNMYFLGVEPSASRTYGIYVYNGSRAEKVSTPYIDKIINGLALDTTTSLYSVHAMSFYGQKAVAFAIDPVTATTQRWLMFFPDLKEWFEWNSTVFTPRGNGTFCLGVGANQHKAYSLNLVTAADNWQDAGTNYDRVHQFQLPTDGNQRKFMSWCGVQGPRETTACTESVQFSDDGGQTWSAARTIDCTVDKKHIYRCGSFGARMVRLTNSSNHGRKMEKFLARVS